MTNLESNPNPYDLAVTDFEGLLEKPFSADSYRAAIAEVQSFGLQEGIGSERLFRTLMEMSSTARIRAASEDKDEAEKFLNMQKGYKAAVDRTTRAATQASDPRPTTRVAGG